LHWAVYLDDRTIWGKEEDMGAMRPMLGAAKEADDAMGLNWHPDKGATTASSKKARNRLQEEFGDLGPMKTTFLLLGVTYNFDRVKRCMPVGAIKDAIARRLKRIGIASKNVRDRIFLTASLVLPKIIWAGA